MSINNTKFGKERYHPFPRFRSTVINPFSLRRCNRLTIRAKEIFYSTTGVYRVTRLKSPRRRKERRRGRGIPVGTNSERDSREHREKEEEKERRERETRRGEARRAERKAKRSDARRQDRPARVQTQRSLSASSG